MTSETEFAAGIIELFNGPLSLRLFLQPCMALLFALRDGKRDARKGADPFIWSILFQSGLRRETIASAWATTGKILVAAIVLDIVLQFATTQKVVVGEAAFMALLLCAVPYSLLRGSAARITRY